MIPQSPLRVALVGYGNMGRECERLAPDHGIVVTAVFDAEHPLSPAVERSFDVLIDFTQPDAVLPTVETACALGVNLVIGTTGWYPALESVRTKAMAAGIGLVHGTNFSVGVHLFYRLLRTAAELVAHRADYDVMMHEWHHRQKKDSPSGTALTAAQVLLDLLPDKTSVATETQHGTIDPAALHVTSTRGGWVVGDHEVRLDSPYDTISIRHTARSRSGFAAGALQAARWVAGRTGVHDIADIIDDLGITV